MPQYTADGREIVSLQGTVAATFDSRPKNAYDISRMMQADTVDLPSPGNITQVFNFKIPPGKVFILRKFRAVYRQYANIGTRVNLLLNGAVTDNFLRFSGSDSETATRVAYYFGGGMGSWYDTFLIAKENDVLGFTVNLTNVTNTFPTGAVTYPALTAGLRLYFTGTLLEDYSGEINREASTK